MKVQASVKPRCKNCKIAKKGEFIVNKRPVSEYFTGEVARRMYTEPVRVVNAQNKYAITIQVEGGGLAGQLDAAILGIARALIILEVSDRKVLKQKGFLTRDARIRERRKVGTGGKARRKKQSPKR